MTNANQIATIMRKAGKARSVAKTEMNARSSRSHAIFTLYLTGQNARKKMCIAGALNLCDLAGSERLSRSQVNIQTYTYIYIKMMIEIYPSIRYTYTYRQFIYTYIQYIQYNTIHTIHSYVHVPTHTGIRPAAEGDTGDQQESFMSW